MIREGRTGRNIRYEINGLLRQSLYARLAGYEDVNDQKRLLRDPAMRAVIGKKVLGRNAESPQTISRFETEILTSEENLEALSLINRTWVSKAVRATKANSRLYDHVEHFMTRLVGRLPRKPKVFYHDFSYRAASWKRSRRVIAKIEWYQGELFPRVGFIVTNLQRKPEKVVRFYNMRGKCKQWINNVELNIR